MNMWLMGKTDRTVPVGPPIWPIHPYQGVQVSLYHKLVITYKNSETNLKINRMGVRLS